MNLYDLEMKIPGFENVESFLRYCEIHSQIPRAAFTKKHAETLYSMVGIFLSDYYDDPIPNFIKLSKSEIDAILRSIMKKDQNRLYV